MTSEVVIEHNRLAGLSPAVGANSPYQSKDRVFFRNEKAVASNKVAQVKE